MGALRLQLARLRADRGLLLLLVVAIAATAAMAGAVPRLLDRLASASLDDAIDGSAPDRAGVEASRLVRTSLTNSAGARTSLEQRAVGLRETMGEAIEGVLGPADVVVDSLRYVLVAPLKGERPDTFVRLLTVRTQLDAPEPTIVDGALPDGTPSSTTVDDRTLPLHEIALSTDTAAVLRMGVGDRWLADVDPEGPAVVRLVPRPARTVVFEVSGIVELAPVEDPRWFGDPRLHRPSSFDTDSNTTFFATALVPPAAMGEHPGADQTEASDVAWRWGLDREALLAADPGAVAADARSLRTTLALSGDDPTWSTGLDRLLAREEARRATAVEVLGLGLVAVALVVVALVGAVGVLLATRRRDAVALVRGRGTSRFQVVAAAVVEAVGVAGAAGVLAWMLLSVVLPGGGGGGLALAVCVAAVVVLVGSSLPDASRPLGRLLAERRRGRAAGRGRPVLELLVVLVAAIAVVAVQQRGVAVDGAADPLVIAAPAAVALAAAVVAARVVPLVLRALAPLFTRGRRGLVAPLGFARATRRRTGGPTVVLVVLGVGVASLATAILVSITDGQARAAAEQVGADVRIEAPPLGTLDDTWTPPDEAGRRVDVATTTGAVLVGDGVQPVDVIIVDAAAALDGAADRSADLAVWDGVGPAPIILSSSFRSAGRPDVGDEAAIVFERQRLVGRVAALDPRVLGFDAEDLGAFVVVDAAAVEAVTGVSPRADTRLVATTDPAAAAASAADADPGARITRRDLVEQAIVEAPLAAGVRIGFAVATAAALLATVLAVVVALVALAPGRRREAATLDALGTPRRTVAATAATEVVPDVALATMAGIGLTVGVVTLLETRLDLAAFTDTADATAVGAPPIVATLVLAVVVVAVAVVAAVVTIGSVDTAAWLREAE